MSDVANKVLKPARQLRFIVLKITNEHVVIHKCPIVHLTGEQCNSTDAWPMSTNVTAVSDNGGDGVGGSPAGTLTCNKPYLVSTSKSLYSLMSLGTGLGRLSHWPSTLDRLANTGSVQNAKQSLKAQKRKNRGIIRKAAY